MLEPAGRGSFADVYLAEEIGAEARRVALKILRAAPEEALAHELRALEGLDDPTLVRVVGHGTLSADGPPFLALEWVDGTGLLEAARLLPLSRLRGLLVQLCRGLDYLHRNGVVHGDLKPSNLRVLRRAGGREEDLKIKILDFGLARLVGADGGHDGGTLVYAAPEILRGGKVDGRADLYSLGVLLYQVLTGTLPFDPSDPAAVLRGHLEETPRPIDRDRDGVPADLVEITTRLLMKDPDDRFASAGALADLMGEAAAAPPGPPPSSAGLRSPALVGRERESQALASFLDGHPRGRDGAGMALILGEGGIGKSRLLAELGDLARRRGLDVHQGSCHETGAEPFGAFLDLLHWAVATAEERDLRGGDDGQEGSLVERRGPEVVKVVPRAFLHPVQASPELQPRYERLRLIDTVGTFLLEVSRARPFLLAVEDLHWADDASADLVEYLVRNRARGRLALAAAARPAESRARWLKDSLEREGGSGSLLRLSLERLDESAVAELARSALDLPSPPPDLAAHLVRETAGNPFFVMEMLRDLVEERLLARDRGGWRWDDDALRRRPRPKGIAQALERRIARTGERERWVLQALALLDRAVDRNLLSRVAAAAESAREDGGASPPGVPDWEAPLEPLIDRGLVVRYGEPPRERFAIAHDAARELIVRNLEGEARRRIHRAAGEALEKRYGTDGEEQIERIAYHFIQAGDDDRSARYCVRAASKARRLYANEEASYFYLQALKYHDDPADPVRWDALGSLGEVRLVQGKVTHARSRYDEMRRLAEAAGDPGRTVTAHLGLADVAWKLSDYRQQMKHARVAFRVARKAGEDLGQADALQVLGLGHYNLGRFRMAVRCYTVALRFLRSTGDDKITCHVLNRMGIAMMSMGDLRRAKSLIDEALALAEKDLRAILQNNLGCIAEQLGNYGEALERYGSAGRIAREVGNRYYIALATLNRAGVLLCLNSAREAGDLIHQSLRMAVELGDRMLQGYLTVFLGRIHRARKEHEDAESYLIEAANLASKIGHLEIRLLAELERARVLFERGELDNAAATAETVWKEASGHALREVAAHAAVLAAEIQRRLNSTLRAHAFLEHGWKFLAETPYAEVEWQAHLCAGKVAEAEGDQDEAGAHYRAGAAILDRVAAGIGEEDLRERYVTEAARLELRVKAARALGRGAAPPPGPRPAARFLEALAGMGRALVGLDTVQEVSQVLLGTALGLVGADRGVVLVRDELGDDRIAGRLQTDDRPWPHDSPWSRRILARAWAGASFSAGARADPGVDPLVSVRELGIRSAAAVPIPGAGGVQGVLYVDARAPGAFGPDQVRLLEALAGQVAPALATLPLAGNGAPAADARRSRDPETFGGMIAVSAGMRAIFERLRRAARSLAPVLIQGESGVGKELAARALHTASPRGSGPFVAIDCGALPESLAESELFGCRRGAFSGALESRRGLLEAAHGGTLFLDEIGNLPAAVQAKLLRALQAGEVRPVGDTRTRRVEFRLVAATNCDLAAEVQAGRFRRDLYYRIAALAVRLPPLRERSEDVPHLARVLLQDIGEAEDRRPLDLTPGAMRALQRHDWAGNVRQLRNVLASAAALADGKAITDRDLRDDLGAAPAERAFATTGREALEANLARLWAALEETGGDKSAAARLLGWSRMRIYRILRRAEVLQKT